MVRMALGQWFSHCSEHHNDLEGFLTRICWAPLPRVSDPSGQAQGPRLCIFNKLTGDAGDAALSTTL